VAEADAAVVAVRVAAVAGVAADENLRACRLLSRPTSLRCWIDRYKRHARRVKSCGLRKINRVAFAQRDLRPMFLLVNVRALESA
jgi:hypothetical protein